jgi:hypothetical protein
MKTIQSAAAHDVSADIQAALTFTQPQDSKPYFKSAALTGGAPEVHFSTENITVDIRDMRPIADCLALDRNGFELHHHRSAVSDFYNDADIKSVYEPELRTLLCRQTGADRVAIFDHTRRSDAAAGAMNPDGARLPASRVHADYTPASGQVRAADAFGADTVAALLAAGGRITQVNVWRPIKGPVLRAPLALARADSVPAESLIATDHIFPDRTGEIYQLAYDRQQAWFWAPEMMPDEVILIKGWDSIADGRAQFTPHGAFTLPGQQADSPPRESIESRCFLAFDPA